MFASKLATLAGAAALILSIAGGSPVTAQDKMNKMDMSRYGGPVYSGGPALTVTASLVKAGGGAEHFSVAKAMQTMVGARLTQAEVAKLIKQYGEEKVTSFIKIQDFAVEDALGIATKAGVTLPKATLSGKKLATTILMAGMDRDGTFYTEYLLDKAVSHKIHCAVMDDIDAKFGPEADTNYHTISNQLWFDVGQALGNKKVKLADLH